VYAGRCVLSWSLCGCSNQHCSSSVSSWVDVERDMFGWLCYACT
jgi:hypothetical protein